MTNNIVIREKEDLCDFRSWHFALKINKAEHAVQSYAAGKGIGGPGGRGAGGSHMGPGGTWNDHAEDIQCLNRATESSGLNDRRRRRRRRRKKMVVPRAAAA